MTVGRRHALPLPANGHQLAEIAAKEFQQELMRFFRPHLAYPNATIKIQWSANFYTTPHNYEGEMLVKVTTEGITETTLQEQGIESQIEMGALDIGVQSPATSPVLTRPGLPSTSQQPVAAESAGRRDINARRGKGIEFSGGGPVNEGLAGLDKQQERMNREAAAVVADLEKGEEQPLHESTIIVDGGTTNG